MEAAPNIVLNFMEYHKFEYCNMQITMFCNKLDEINTYKMYSHSCRSMQRDLHVNVCACVYTFRKNEKYDFFTSFF